jgi:predicted signal transduction protein with EAL and GGDEF domain
LEGETVKQAKVSKLLGGMAGLRQKIAQFGQIKMVILMTALAILLSVSMTMLLWLYLFQREFDWAPVVISIVVPTAVCPLLVWYVIGVTLNLHHLESRMRYLANYDTLTQVMSRRAFLMSFEQQLALSMRNQTSLAVAYLDLDDFKTVNDKYRHAMGDQVLARFASVLKSNMRKHDLIGRMGGGGVRAGHQ